LALSNLGSLPMTRISVISVWVIVLIGVMSMEAVAGPNDDLLAAAKSGERSGVEAAIAQGASVNAVDEKGLSPVGLNGMTATETLPSFY
jgi:hypothetical protein